ncbi:MAG: hypothetical protein US60_C0010G0021 [Microgenomates group bacterium GW2011_GWC1_37_8]|uniref:Lipopolysaccharide assembly protein A domain-containing protein n=2 Tax=Candidatus Woeseibacteriota TaxID=1752722 RepID=A0A0G0P6R8_9BACT|nr:MAG: hypothetical protein US60_C0010G0021 [Microgenomates group bacterium GW2011_GWC1_37_8]KKQ85011.1 MAG: hypothetical protein UT08_C0011G0029 [Candidatus Woesebacteria bacterium GW2011_GWB1_38_8]OGM20474.1 MAG: hypothetical protein A2863_01415 [Candidatus Woesebacteria bacterium RIFCSPHIGHO2_01_FULL_38_9b]
MLVLVLVIIFGVAFSYFATQNTGGITIYLGSYTLGNIPLYLVVLGSMAICLSIAGLIYLLKNLSSSLTISEKESELRDVKKELAEITKHAHKLELENTKLKAKAGIEDFDDESF